MVKRDIAFRFQDGRRYAEDFLLWLEIAHAGLGICMMEVPLAYVHKPFYGAGGLSAAMWSMERAELYNFRVLYQAGAIGLFSYLTAVAFSAFKFVARVLSMRLTRFSSRF